MSVADFATSAPPAPPKKPLRKVNYVLLCDRKAQSLDGAVVGSSSSSYSITVVLAAVVVFV